MNMTLLLKEVSFLTDFAISISVDSVFMHGSWSGLQAIRLISPPLILSSLAEYSLWRYSLHVQSATVTAGLDLET